MRSGWVFLVLAVAWMLAGTAAAQEMQAIRGVVSGVDQEVESVADSLALIRAVPQPFKAFPETNFTIGYGVSLRDGRDPIHGFSIGTNLMGAAAGGAFDLVGIKALRDYFVNNASNAISLPVDGAEKLSVDLGLGLGEVRLKGTRLWPVLGIRQFDREDPGIPESVVAGEPDQSTWAVPYIGLGILLRAEQAEQKLKTGSKDTVFPVVAVGATLPYYYAGDMFSALGALFGEKISDYQRVGDTTLFVSLSIPLFPTEPVKRKTS